MESCKAEIHSAAYIPDSEARVAVLRLLHPFDLIEDDIPAAGGAIAVGIAFVADLALPFVIACCESSGSGLAPAKLPVIDCPE